MRRNLVISLTVMAALLLGGPGGAAGKVSRLGTDPSGDGPPALDVTFLDVTRTKADLEIRIGVDTMFPVIGGYPEAPGIEWIFTTGKRDFIAEAVASRTPKFFLFELKDDSYEQLQGMTGTYDAAEGFIRMLIPLKLIGAKKGTVIAGIHDPIEVIGKEGTADVDSHVHDPAGLTTTYSDEMTTTKSFIVP